MLRRQSSTNTESPNAMSNRTAPHEARVTTLDEIIPNTRILVVDDDDLLRGIVEAILIDAGYGTGGANDGEEALIMLATDHFDLVTATCRDWTASASSARSAPVAIAPR